MENQNSRPGTGFDFGNDRLTIDEAAYLVMLYDTINKATNPAEQFVKPNTERARVALDTLRSKRLAIKTMPSPSAGWHYRITQLAYDGVDALSAETQDRILVEAFGDDCVDLKGGETQS